MQFTENFTLKEFEDSDIAERHKIINKADGDAQGCMKGLCINILQPLRDYIDSALDVSSGYRCLELNRLVKSGDHSQHLKGQAGDVKSKKYTAKELCLLIIKLDLPFDQLIYEGNWCHVSFSFRNRSEVLTAIFHKDKDTEYVTGIVDK